MDLQDLNNLRSIEELTSYRGEVVSRMTELDSESNGLPFKDDVSGEFAALKEQRDEIDKRVSELRFRKQQIEGAGELSRETLSFNTPKAGVSRGDDIYDTSTIRSGIDGPNKEELRDRAMRSIETSSFPAERGRGGQPGVTQDELRGRVENLVEMSRDNGEVAKLVLLTGSPTYKRAWTKAISSKPLSHAESDALARAASLTTTAGGFAVPYTLDPTVILTNNGAINPVRQIANVITITGNTWNGVSSAGITAAYVGEAVQSTDNAPTLAQPTANVEMARAFVPMSIEVSEDWGSIQSEMARMFSDAKDILESDKFLKGLGHASIQPEGLLVGANTATQTTATASVVAVADLYAMENGLAPRWRSRATFVGGKAFAQKVRQFDTGGGASLWTQLRFGDPADLIGYPWYEWSDYSSAVTTPNSTVATIGDFNQFMIIDRVGMSVELIPHLFHTFNSLPSGQRGLFAYWRNTSDVTVAAAFKHLRIS